MNSANYFITGIGTDVGKTVAAAIIAEAIGADYWKPIQAGFANGTDTEWIEEMLMRKPATHPELYKFKLAASPHIAAREENIQVEIEKIYEHFKSLSTRIQNETARKLVIEGPGGVQVPLNDQHFVVDLIKKLGIPVIIVSRNYLGSINHSILTAKSLAIEGIEVAGWVFNDNYMKYEKEIAAWSGYPILFSIPGTAIVNQNFIRRQAALARETLLQKL
jgi:dethiobiotin synthetase